VVYPYSLVVRVRHSRLLPTRYGRLPTAWVPSDDERVASEEDLKAARTLAAVAQVGVIRIRGGNPEARSVLERLKSRLWDLLEKGLEIEQPTAGWLDAWSRNRPSWRVRAAHLHGDEIFGVDYNTCRRCRLGWVEEPAAPEPYRRCGLARAALAALRSENPGLQWHTLGGHLSDAVPFWEAAAVGVPGGYTKHSICPHRRIG
jgi:hypothetical protein